MSSTWKPALANSCTALHPASSLSRKVRMENIPCVFIYRIALAVLLTEFSTTQALVTSSFIERKERKSMKPSDRKSTRLNSSHANISYAVFCLKKKNNTHPYLHT